ncbi:MAG: ribonuclease III, partial [Rubrivivax sp.]
VKQDTLHRIALTLDIASALRLGEGETRSGGRARPSILADTLEALIGAVYLDAGYDVAQQLVHRLFGGLDISATMQAAAKDPKTELQEWLQGRKLRLPAYRVVATLGAAHRQTFDVECAIVEENLAERGIGASRRAGEQAAAAAMLIKLKARHP